jgi:cysteine desulfuration protein SufE
LLTGLKPELDAFNLFRHRQGMTLTFVSLLEDFALFDDWEDKYRTIIELGRALEPMPAALKTDATKVRGCSSQVWLHAMRQPDGSLHFLGDSDAHIVRGLVAVLFTLFQNKQPAEIAAIDARENLNQLGLGGALSANRTNGLYSMVARIQDAARQAL